MKMMMKLGVLAAVVTAAMPALLQAQVPLSPRALGVGGAYIGVARGNDAVFQNPANLALPGGPRWSLALPQLAIGGTLLGPNVRDLPELLNFDEADESRRSELLATIPQSGTEFQYDLRFPAVTWSMGPFGLGVSYGSVGQHTVGRDLVELVFEGYEEGRTDYRVGNTRGSRATFIDFAGAYGRRFGPLSVGVTGHYVRGGSIVQSRLFEPRIDVEARSIEIDYLTVIGKGGSGYGVDVGAAFQPTPAFTLSGVVANAYRRMTWSDDLVLRSLTLDRNDIDNSSAVWDFIERYESSDTPIDPSSTSLAVFETMQGLYDEAYFPTVAHVGAAWSGTSGTDVSASYRTNLTEGRLGERWGSAVSFGIQQKLAFLGVRAGFGTDLDGRSITSGGFSLGPLHVSAAKLDDGELEGAIRSGWIGSFGVSVAAPAAARTPYGVQVR